MMLLLSLPLRHITIQAVPNWNDYYSNERIITEINDEEIQNTMMTIEHVV